MNIRRLFILTAGVIAAIIGLIFVFVIIIYLIFLLPPVQNYVLSVAQNKINSYIKGTVTIGNIRTNLLSFVELNNILATSPDRRCDSIFVKQLKVHFQPLALLSRTVHISSFDINSVSAMISIPQKGNLQISVMPRSAANLRNKEGASGTKWKFFIESAKIQKVEATYCDSNDHFTGHIKNGLIECKLTKQYTIPVSLKIPEGYFSSPWWNGNVDTIESSLLITKAFLNINNLTIRGSGSSCSCGGQIPFVKNGVWDLSAVVKTRLEPLLIFRACSPLSQHGVLNAEMSWNGTFKKPVLSLNLTGRGLRLYNVNIDSLKLAGKYLKDTLVSSMSVCSNAGKAEGRLNAIVKDFFTRFNLTSYTSDFQISITDFSYLHNKFRNLKLSGNENAEVSLTAFGKEFNFPDSITFKANSVNLCGEPLDIRGSLRSTRWNFSSIWGMNSFNGDGFIYDFNQIKGFIKGAINEPSIVSNFFFRQNTSGSLLATLNLSGIISNPSTVLNVKISKLQWKELSAENVVSKIIFQNKLVVLENTEGKLSGTIDSVLEYFGADSCGGNFTTKFKISGPIDKLNAQVNFNGKDVYFKKISLDSLKGTVLKDTSGKIIWLNTEISKNGSKIQSDGTFFNIKAPVFGSFIKIKRRNKNQWADGGQGKIDGKIYAKNIDILFSTFSLDLSAINSFFALEDPIYGLLTTHGHIEGSINNPQIRANVNVDKPGFGTFTVGKITGDLYLKDSVFKTDDSKVTLSDTSTFNVSVRYPTIPSKGWQIDTFGTKETVISVRSDSFNLRGLNGLLGNTVNARGDCGINLTLKNSHGPWNLSGNVAVTAGHIVYQPLSIETDDIKFNSTLGGTLKYPEVIFDLSTGISKIRSAKINSSIFEGTLKGDTLHLLKGYAAFENGGELRVMGTIPLVKFDSLFASVDPGIEFNMTEIPINLLESFIPDFHVKSGTIAGNCKLSIYNGKLYSYGKLHLDKGLFSFDWLDSDIGPLNGEFSLEGDSLIIDNLSGKMGKGKFEVSGNTRVLPGGLFHIDIAAKGSDVSFQITDLINLNVNTMSVKLTNKGNGYLIEGNMSLGPTTFVRDIRINDMLEMTSKKNPFLVLNNPLNKWALKIGVLLQQNLFVNMNLGNLQLDGNIAVSGTAASPGYVGEVKVVEGYLNYLDRRFEISKGVLVFDNPFVLNPTFEINASTDAFAYAPGSVQPITYQINLSLTGDLQYPVIVLSSVPQLSEPDILSILTLGTTLNAVGSDVASRIGSLVGQELLGLGARRLGKLLGLESLSISGGIIGSGTGPSVTLTKSISQRIIIIYQTGITTLNQQRVSAIFRIFPFLYLVGGADQNGNADIKLNYRIFR